jgi:hypothetical protein
MSDVGAAAASAASIRAFMELADINIVGVAGVLRIGELRVPDGAPEAGRTFASAFLDIAARSPALLANELDTFQYIYSCFYNCPPLRATVGHWDDGFMDLAPQSAAAWAAMQRSATAASPSSHASSTIDEQD